MNTGESGCRVSGAVYRRLLSTGAATVLSLLVLCSGTAAWAQIDPPPGSCNPSSPDACPQNDNLCTIERCNPTTLRCESVPVVCADDNSCTVDACIPETGQCGHTAVTCADDNSCTADSCDPSTGECGHTAVTCADDNDCTVDSCEPFTGECGHAAIACGDENPCTVDSCDPATGQCRHAAVECDQDDNLCTTETCDPSTGGCEPGDPRACTQNDNLCTVEACVPSTGECESGAPKSCEEDPDPCTTEVCQPATGSCASEPTNPPPDECGAAICRTPGFWGTHGGTEKTGSSNITQAVIIAAGGSLSMCGETIETTIVNDDASALEAVCVSPSGVIRLQLARQLTAAALNCVVSDGDADCSSTQLYDAIFSSCNAVCTNSSSSSASVTSCIGQLDCLNNGGRLLANGYCQTGTCAGEGSPCKTGTACLDASACVPLPGNCHDRPLNGDDPSLSFEPVGNAGSSTACQNASKSGCTAIGSTQSRCLY